MTDYCVSSVYAEFGSLSTDAITMTFTHADLSSTKMYNVLLQQIPCDAEYKLVPINIYSIHLMHYWYILCAVLYKEFCIQGSNRLRPILHGPDRERCELRAWQWRPLDQPGVQHVHQDRGRAYLIFVNLNTPPQNYT